VAQANIIAFLTSASGIEGESLAAAGQGLAIILPIKNRLLLLFFNGQLTMANFQ
jgi:hypothetical protein